MFQPTDATTVREFNVLCVTKQHDGENSTYDRSEWHLPITGIVLVVNPAQFEEGGVMVQKATEVTFHAYNDGRQYSGSCAGVRSGLGGTAVTVEMDIEMSDAQAQKRTERWALYTSDPTIGHLVEEVRKMAEENIAKNKRE